ncbi:MAG: hypothetical protein V2A61_00680 [Calditrichota bacterium]
MKILYVSPEHISGGLTLWRKGHRERGQECRWITFFRNQFGFEEDLCFDLAWMPVKSPIAGLRRLAHTAQNRTVETELPGNPPWWEPPNLAADIFFHLRDTINAPRIEQTIARYGLNDYDLYHFEQGVDPYRDSRWGNSLARRGKGIVCFYHGSDVRNRGVISEVHRVSHLNLTSEIDLLSRLPGMKYLFLPIDTNALKPSLRLPDGRVRIAHAARNRKLKGSDVIEAVVKRLMVKYPVDWVMIEHKTHAEALRLKAQCDMFIDQITDLGGWGYGASSVEALCLGLPVLTRVNQPTADFLGEHPFINVTAENLESRLIPLIKDASLRMELGIKGRAWVIKNHGLDAVMNRLYGYYREAGMV